MSAEAILGLITFLGVVAKLIHGYVTRRNEAREQLKKETINAESKLDEALKSGKAEDITSAIDDINNL